MNRECTVTHRTKAKEGLREPGAEPVQIPCHHREWENSTESMGKTILPELAIILGAAIVHPVVILILLTYNVK